MSYLYIKILNPHPLVRTTEPSTRYPQQRTHNLQPANRNLKPATRNPQPCFAVNLGLMDYNQAWALQSDLVAAKIDGRLSRDIILLVEHPSVFTLGRRGGRDYLQVGEAVLKQAGIPIVQAERGGYITFHGPGQAVVYPIFDLEERRLGVAEYVAALEEIMLQTVGSLGLQAQRSSTNPGIWMDNRKMGSIGIALRKGISFHGLALNVNLDLAPFSWIQPCGLAGVSMTSVQQELGKKMEKLFKDAVRNGEIDKDALKKMSDALQSMKELGEQDLEADFAAAASHGHVVIMDTRIDEGLRRTLDWYQRNAS